MSETAATAPRVRRIALNSELNRSWLLQSSASCISMYGDFVAYRTTESQKYLPRLTGKSNLTKRGSSMCFKRCQGEGPPSFTTTTTRFLCVCSKMLSTA